MTMVLKAESKILKNPDANTQYITIPSSMTIDSQYPFKPNDAVELEVDEKKGTLIVRRSSKKP
jgi:hypothetical protein